MKKNTILILTSAIILIAVFSLYFTQNKTSESASNSNQINSQTTPSIPASDNNEPSLNTIEMSSTGFSPSTLTIKQGESVIFKAVDSSNRWPATDIHPSHKLYPGSDISKCGTQEQSTTFDSCGTISEGSTYEFTFNEKGTWRYHDHKQPSKTGTIIVE